MKKITTVFCALFFMGTTSFAANGVWTGWVSDAKCGASVDPACAKKCAAEGQKIVFVTSDKKVLDVANPELLKGHAGEHVKVKGKLDGGNLTVANVEVIKEPIPDKK